MLSPNIESQRVLLLPKLQAALEFSQQQARRILRDHPGYTPMYTVGGRWNQEGETWTHWCEGFFPGILWMLAGDDAQSEFRAPAEALSRKLEARQFDRNVHDLGFLFFSTYWRWYRRTGDPALREVLIQAGRTLAMRRQVGGYLASFIGPQSLFIDIMMNVGIIAWAARETGDDNLSSVAIEHCRVTEQTIVRRDGSTAHEGLFDVTTGAFLGESTHQGYAAGSAWTRGIAWAIYGFTAMHRLTGYADFLTTARHCADYFIRRAMPTGMVPWWDFDIPEDGPRMWDSSAGAIAASGLWDLAESVPEGDDRDRYYAAALTALETLSAPPFLATDDAGWEGILKHGIYHFHKGLGVDESVAWGEHFYVEAVLKALAGHSEAAW